MAKRPVGPNETVVFTNGATPAVRLLKGCKLAQGQKVRMWRDGNRIVIDPLEGEWPKAFQNVAGIWKEEIPRPPS
jgi:virulence-associated protein VagC